MSTDPSPQKLYKDKLNHRAYSLASLREMIEDRFGEETGGRPDILADLDTRAKQLQAIGEVADYLLATEYITLPAEERRQIIAQAVDNLFYFGLLDPYLRDPQTTELNLESFTTALVAQGWEKPRPIGSPFYGIAEVERWLERLLALAHLRLSLEEPFIEVGLTLHGRPARLSVAGPPANPMYSTQLRLHRPEPFQLTDFAPVIFPTEALELLKGIIAEGRGILITGEASTGKSALLGAILNSQTHSHSVVVERATELTLTDASITRLAVIPPQNIHPDRTPTTFAQQIQSAITASPKLLALDEVRGDESAAWWGSLTTAPATQLITIFRGTSQPKRLLSALSMALRKHHASLESSAIYAALLQQLPYVVALHRTSTQPAPRLALIGRWVAEGDGLGLQALYPPLP